MLKRLLFIPRLFSSRFRKPQQSDYVTTFEQLGLPEQVLNHLKQFEAPSQIQSKSMKSLMQGEDMIAIAPTGSGKTLAFAIPALLKSAELNKQRRSNVTTLIICPTRQLSNQITNAIKPIANQFGLRIANLFGGAPKREQFYDARMAQVIVATPGRLRDYISYGYPDKLKNVHSLILDEADRMLDMGFEQQVKDIISQTPTERQTSLFSATWQKQIEGMASQYIKPDAMYIQIGSNTHTINPNIQQEFKCLSFRQSKEDIGKVISSHQLKKALIFCNTKQQTRKLAFQLNQLTDKTVSYITSDLDQYQRTSVMKKFRQSQRGVLVATDVASRGIDVKDIELVINFGFPSNCSDFIHRVGRTGRGGKSGKSLTYIFKGDSKYINDLKFVAKLYSNEKLAIPKTLQQIIEDLGMNFNPRSNTRKSGYGGRGEYRSRNRQQTQQPRKKSQSHNNDNSFDNFRSRSSRSQEWRSRRHSDDDYN